MAEPSSRSPIRAGSLRIIDAGGQPYEGAWLGMANDIEGDTEWLRLGGIAGRLSLDTDRVRVRGRLEVAGDLRVEGDHNLLKVFERTLVVMNAGTRPGSWGVDHPNTFSRVYTAFAVFQGFGLSVTADVDSFASEAQAVRWSDARAITQHCFVRVLSSTPDATKGIAYVAESNRDYEVDNGALITVVVLGKGL
jgi:hypothetical protein